MIIVNYKSKRKLKKAIGKPLDCEKPLGFIVTGEPFFVTNHGGTFHATVVMENGIVKSVR